MNTFLVVEKLREKDLEYGYDMRLKCFEQLEDAILYSVTAFMRVQLPFSNYNELYETNVYVLGKDEKIL